MATKKPVEETEPVEEKRPLSQAGNPYPDKLEPVVIEYGRVAGVPIARQWPRPLDPNPPPPDRSGLVATQEYLYENLAPGDPRFTLFLSPRRANDTDAQYESYRRAFERHMRAYGVRFRLCQSLCTWLGNAASCGLGPCRRLGRCAGRRDEHRFALDFAVYPPCVPLDLEIMESYRAEISRAVAGRAKAAA